MKYGILGDIHGNLSALRAALEGMRKAGVERIVSVGDVVGYGAAPAECIALLREHDATVVLGNHDAAVAEILDDMHFNPYARAAVAWTREALTAEDLAWLRARPLTATLDDLQVAHGTLHRPELFNYILSVSDAEPSLDIMVRPLCVVGHSHVPLTAMRFADDPHRTAYTYDPEVDLSATLVALSNVGSVGQPRDDDPRTAFLIYDSETRRASLRRAPYDIECEVDRIVSAGLPEVLAERLRLGV